MEADISEQLAQGLLWSRAIALELRHQTIQVSDVVLGVLQVACETRSELSGLRLDQLLSLKKSIEQRPPACHHEQSSHSPRDLLMSADATTLLDRALGIASDRKHVWCRLSHVLLAALRQGGSLAEAFAKSGITKDDLEHVLQDDSWH